MNKVDKLRQAAVKLRESSIVITDNHSLREAIAEWLEGDAEEYYEGLDTQFQDFIAGDYGGDPDPAIVVADLILGKSDEGMSP